MTRKTIGLFLLLVASLFLGLIQGICFYRLFEKTMPPLALSSFNQGAAQFMFYLYGLLSGLTTFVLTLVAILVSPVFRGRGASAAQ